MSWTRRETPHEEFTEQATNTAVAVTHPRWRLDIWEVADDAPQGRWHSEKSSRCLRNKANVRIVFAPLDMPQRGSLPQMIELFHILDIPRDFSAERTRDVSHSFGQRTTEHGWSAWFHYLCKSIEVKENGSSDGASDGDENEDDDDVDNNNQDHQQQQSQQRQAKMPVLAQADHSWQRSGFFLRGPNDGGATLVCFGAKPLVKKRIKDFVAGKAWSDVGVNPLVLFDLVLEGLQGEVDNAMWKMNKAFSPLEQSVLGLTRNKATYDMSSKTRFSELHNCGKHMVHLTEAVESCIMVVDSVTASAENRAMLQQQFGDSTASDPISPPTPGLSGSRNSSDASNLGTSLSRSRRRALVDQQLKECLQYRRSLFRSTQLRLTSLQKRIDAATTLSTTLSSQGLGGSGTGDNRYSSASLQAGDSSSLRILTALALVFLPMIGVATVAGSQLLVSEREREDGEWEVSTTPLFWLTLWIAIPLTVGVALLAMGWLWWTSRVSVATGKPRTRVARGWRGLASLWKKRRTTREESEEKSNE